MPLKGTADPIGRTFKIIQMFVNAHDGVTIQDIIKAFGVADNTARYWRDQASILMPIRRDGVRENGNVGYKSHRYKLIDKKCPICGK